MVPARPISSKRPKYRTQYNDRNQCDNHADDHSHHHIEIAFAVGQSADLKHCQDRAIVGKCVERAGADCGHAMHQCRINAVLDGKAQRWEEGFLSTRCLTIAGGTSEVQRNVIAERILGQPRDPEPGA